MKYCLITFRSITPAQRAERLLHRRGYACSLQRTPKWMEIQGCGYSLRILNRDVPSCIAFLNEENIPYRKTYLLRENGVTEELIL